MRAALTEGWVDNPYNGLVTAMGPVPLAAHDPDVHLWGATLSRCGPRTVPDQIGGAGWTEESARLACTGEAIERFQPYPLPTDGVIRGSWAELEGRLRLSPEQLKRFHDDQYAWEGNPFEPFTGDTICDWVACRDVRSGEAVWAPAETIYLYPPGYQHRFGPGISTGLSCGRKTHPVVLSGLREVIERDAVLGAWWGVYDLEELEENPLGHRDEVVRRISRPNLRYRYYRVRSPHSEMVTLVSLTGEDQDGPLFSIGSACRETVEESFEKSLLEAVQGRHFVRYLASRRTVSSPATEPAAPPRDFMEHAQYYSRHPGRLASTVLENATPAGLSSLPSRNETRDRLLQALGDRRVVTRLMTPPAVGHVGADWQVARVWIEGMQALHGNHQLPFLGGALWKRPVADWLAIPPHPFA